MYSIVRLILAAKTAVFSFDEILTATLASQHSLTDVYHALLRAVDGQPLFFYMIERAALHVLQNPHVALRLPSILAMAGTMACVFAYARKCCGDWVALLCSILLISTKLFQGAAIDARPYSLMVACFALALVCHQRLPSLRWAGGMTLALTLAQSFHYYAIFGLLAFGLAEGAVLIFRRTFRWYVWVGLGISVLPLLLAWRLLSEVRAYYGAHFWSHYSASDVPRSYANFLMTSPAVGIAVAVVCLAGVSATFWWPGTIDNVAVPVRSQILAEGILLTSLILLPLIAYLVLRLARGGMTDRYLIETVLGISLSVALLFRGATPKGVAFFAVFVVVLAALHEFSFWRSFGGELPAYAVTAEKLVQDAGQPNLPVVVSEGTEYVELVYYAPSAWTQRLVYLADPQRAVEFTGTDSVDKGILVLRNFMPLQVSNLEEFLSKHGTFLLYDTDSRDEIEWLPYFLTKAGASMQAISRRQNGTIYLVKLREAGSF